MGRWDLFVIGGGSGGVRVARTAAAMGARVALAEVLHLGGTCVNVGCVPKKLLVYAAHYGEGLREAAGFGWTLAGSLDWRTLIARKNTEIERLNGVYARLLDSTGVHRIAGRATVLGPHTVEVAGERHEADHIVVATGGRPRVPAIPGRELGCTSNEVFFLDRLPQRVLVVGGGYIGVEFAGIFHGLGAEVALLHNHDRLLNHFDRDLGEHLGQELIRKGIDVRLGVTVEALREGTRGAVTAELSGGERITADLVLFATGRVPNSHGIGLGAVGVARDPHGAVLVDAGYRTSVPSIYALGDVTGGAQLTPVALAEGTVLAKRLFGGEPDAYLDYGSIPTAVFSSPEVGTVGLSEEVARQTCGDVDIYRSVFTPLRHTLTGTGEKAMMKLVVARATQQVVGVHLVCADAGEMLQGFAVAVKLGARKSDLDATIGIHPTAAEELVTMRTPVA